MKFLFSLVLVLGPSAAFAQSGESAGILNTVEASGVGPVTINRDQPNFVALKSSGIYCPKDPSVERRAMYVRSLPNLLAATTCSLEVGLADLRVGASDIVDARVLYVYDADFAELTLHFNTEPTLAAINWRFEKVARTTMFSPLTRYSFEIKAISPHPNPALTGL